MSLSNGQIVVCGSQGAGKTALVNCLLEDDRLRGRVVELSSEEAFETFPLAALKADVVIVTVDATQDVGSRARWQSQVALRLGVRHVIVALNKIDCVEDPARVLDELQREFAGLTARLGHEEVAVVPVAALHGHNVLRQTPATTWFGGPTLAECVDRPRQAGVSTNSKSASASADAFEATLVWTAEQPMLQGRSYPMQSGTRTVAATVAPLKYRIDPATLQHVPAKVLRRGEIGVCQLDLERPIDFNPAADAREAHAFTLYDAGSAGVAGVGVLHFELRRSQNVRWQRVDIDKTARAALHRHRPCVIWFTGLSGAGKSTIANLVERQLHDWGCHTYLLDGDNVRHGLNKDLGFTDADRVENIRRVAEVARLMVDAGLIVLVSFISPFRAERRMARALVDEGEFIEVFVDVPLDVAEARDPKGLYKKARRGELKNFTGLDSPYELPEHPEVRLDTAAMTPEDAAQVVLRYVQQFLL
jgi:adenylyl-sulfate kinase